MINKKYQCATCGFIYHNTHKLTLGEISKLTIKVNEDKITKKITNKYGYCPVCLSVKINQI